ncbi:mRNA-decapping enzyme 1A [Anopheles aquasalis]|uniref:mRNA-decapping enzyme 1A n=1 Tax=Anopheles aquasalis TaxID=42839 RepID=UPI00215AB614|nr:mRNA-decapping enzyme 1A [Anopheles aquasalis]XP_050082738.1 mRNA-decapping enzyme 1A [Anopheles aquasalis]
MADQTELRMNLVAIKRVDPYAKDIINSSAHVAFYVFNNEDSEWEKTDIEGALFIYSRFAEPFHSIFINNRLNTNSLVEPIRGQIELQSKPPFLLYRNERSRIRGFWFYNNTECDRIGEIIQRLVTDCAEAEKLNPVVNGGGGAGGGSIPPGMLPVMNGNGPAEVEANNVDIFSMLTKAQEDYQNNAATTTGGGAKDPAVINHTGMTVLGGHNMPIVPVPATQQQHHQQQQQPISNQNAPRSVVNFFAAAKQPAASEVPLFKTHAPVHTLEQIEKLHRASTPQKDLTIAGSVNTTGKLTPDLNELKRMGAIPIMGSGNGPHTPSGGLPELGTSPLATFLSTANLSTAMRLNNNQAAVPKAKLIDISELESRQNHHSQQQQQTPLHELLKKSESIAVTGTPTTPSIVRPALMPPTMFKPTVAASSSVGVAGTPGTGTVGPQSALSDLFTQVTSRSAGGGGTVTVSGAKVSSGATGKQAGSSSGAKGGKSRDGTGNTPPKQAGGTPKSVADILSKAAANSKQNNNVHNATSTASGNANGSNNNNNLSSSSTAAGGTVEPLTQNQLIQAVSYLIKHDPDFVRKLHEAYVRSFAEMMISN